ncbi:MAG: glycosyltransferase family 1 protein [Proteobacteria bacterium]|nr:glycosyltransferase family 1 protein [Pseudomonadota bacterium]
MRVLVDARKIDDGGIGTYTRNLVAGALEHAKVEIGVLCGSDRTLPTEWQGKVTVHHDDTPCYSLSEMFLFPKHEVAVRYDLLHVPHYTLPHRLPIPAVVTVHDLIQVTHPARWYHPMIASRLIQSALRRARRVLTVSSAIQRDLAGFVQGDESITSKIRVVPNALDPQFCAQKSEAESTRPSTAPYLLSVCSTAKPHKGTHQLLEAFSMLTRGMHKGSRGDERAGCGADLQLKVVGRGATPERLAALGDGVQRNVEFLGEVDAQKLARLYASATALVVPSLAEGFCLPVLEAQAFGVPVVTTPIPAVEDLVTQFDTVAEGFSPRALAEAMQRALQRSDNQGPEEVSSEYRRHLARFDRKRLAGEVVSVYQEALNDGVNSGQESEQ